MSDEKSQVQDIVVKIWPVVLFIFSAGIGWGVHQASINVLFKDVGQLQGEIKFHREESGAMKDRLTRIETKVDILLKDSQHAGD